MDIFFDSEYDMTLENGDIRFTKPDEELVQTLTIHLQFLLSEWFLDTSQGIPYTQTIFDLNANDLKAVYVLFRTEIKNVEGVEKINTLNIDIDRDNKTLSLSLKVNGTTEIEVTI